MRWVFIRPTNHSPYYDPEIQEPLGLEYLAASRVEKGDAVLLLDCTLSGHSEARLARRAVSFKPDIIGFSLTTAQEIDSVHEIYHECQAVLAGRSLSWLAGGNFVSSEPAQAQKLLPPGFTLVRFEGEQVLAALAAAHAIGSPAAIHEGSAVKDLDSLPFPHRPFARQILASDWAFNLQGSRGCCGACRYCSSPGMLDKEARRWRGRSPAHIAEEIEVLYRKLGARSFNFVDEDFLGPEAGAGRRARDLSAEIRRRNMPITFGIQVRPVTLDEEIIGQLTAAGLDYVFLGIESDDPEDFKRWGRPWSPRAWEMVKILQDRGVEVNAGVMLFHSHSTFKKIRRFANKLHRFRLLNYRTVVNTLDAMPGSIFHKQALKTGQIDPDTSGPQALPFVYPEVKPFYDDLIQAINPLGPPSMHALCSLLPVLARRMLAAGKESEFEAIKGIVRRLDEAAAKSLFQVLDFHEKGSEKAGLISTLRRRNLDIALEESRHLVAHGFAPSFDGLRQAIRLDAGI